MTDIIWDEHRIGIASQMWMKLEQIFESKPLPSRTIVYENTFQLSITYEIEDKLFE